MSDVSPYFLVYGKDPSLSHVTSFSELWHCRLDHHADQVLSILGKQLELGIINQTSCVYTPRQNRIAERKDRHLLNVARSLMFQGSVKPKSYLEASQNPKWVEAMNLEMEALHRNNTYALADLPPGRKAIGCKWIWKIKYKSSSEVDNLWLKVSQKEGI
nr:putative reverse transcriptase, RNA-dependent DNA polymerase, Gag-polypeptide of LTR copia-type [Tanacetum cinerariifolium]